MADAVIIEVQTRDPAKNQGTGSRVSRRLRSQGRVPAIIYGHKKANVPISLSREDVAMMLKKSTRSAELRYGGNSELAVVRDVQWDHLGNHIIHLDFYRVDPGEEVEAEIPLELHGVAPGLAEGGRLDQQMHSLRIKAKATDIPSIIRVEIGDLHLNQAIHIRELALPAGVSPAPDLSPEQMVVHIVERPTAAAEETEAAAETPKKEGE